MTVAPVIDIDRGRHIRLRRIVNDHKTTYGVDYPTDVFGMVASLPADQLTDGQRWMLNQITPDHRARCAAVWTEVRGGPRIPTTHATPPETRPLTSVPGDSQVHFPTNPVSPTNPGGARV